MAGSDPQVAVRFAVKDAEVVRQALQNLGKDGETALKRFDAAAKPVSKSLTAVSDVVSDLKGRSSGAAGSLGLAGTALLGLGPIGLAVGAALGVLYLALNRAAEGADALATKGQELKSFAAVTGLTLGQAAAVSHLGVAYGISSEQVRTFVERFTGGMDEVRRAEGPLFEAINRIDAPLARQIAASKTSAEALELLARAYQLAGEQGDKFRQGRLARLAGGRGAAETAQILIPIAANGVQGVVAENQAAGKSIDADLIDRITRLKAQIEDTRKTADRLWASMYAESVMTRQLAIETSWKNIAQSIGEIKAGGGTLSWLEILGAGVDRWVQATAGISPPQEYLDQRSADLRRRAQELAIGNLRKGLSQGQTSNTDEVYGNLFKPADSPASGDDAAKKVVLSAEALANIEKRRIALLGAAATPTEQLRLKTLELAAAVEKDGTLRAVATRALDAENKKLAEAAVAARERLGIAGEEEIRAVRLRQVEKDRADGYIKSAAEMAVATKLVTKEASDQAKAIEVKISDFPALTKLRQEGENTKALLDTELSGAIRGTTSDILAMAKGTETASQGFANMATKITDAVAQAILMKAIVGPLSGSSASILSSFFAGGAGAGAPTNNPFGGVNNPTFSRSAHGNVFDTWGLRPFAMGGIVDRPTMFRFGAGSMGLMGEGGPEAIIPLHRDPAGRLGVRSNGGGAPVVNVEVHNYHSGADVQTKQRSDGTLEVHINDMINRAVAGGISSPRGPVAQALTARDSGKNLRG